MTNHDERLEELRASGETIAELAEQPELFAAAAEAFRAQDAERFQDALGRAGLLDRCHWICRWFCSKHCVFVCRKLVGTIDAEPIRIAPDQAVVEARTPAGDRESAASIACSRLPDL